MHGQSMTTAASNLQHQSYLGAQNMDAVSARPPTALSQAVMQVERLVANAAANCQASQGILSRAFGEGPSPGSGGNKPVPVPSGDLAELGDKLETLSNLIEAQANMLARIATVV